MSILEDLGLIARSWAGMKTDASGADTASEKKYHHNVGGGAGPDVNPKEPEVPPRRTVGNLRNSLRPKRRGAVVGEGTFKGVLTSEKKRSASNRREKSERKDLTGNFRKGLRTGSTRRKQGR